MRINKKTMIFKDRTEAGFILSELLMKYKNKDAVVFAIPRGGVVVGFEIAKMLNLPLDVVVVRKIGAPYYQEYALGAIAEEGVKVLNENEISNSDLTLGEVAKTTQRENEEVKRRVEEYRNGFPIPDLTGKTVLLIDDGLATGYTALAAIKVLQKHNPKSVIFAVPVCSLDLANILYRDTNLHEIVYIRELDFGAVGNAYITFEQVTDSKVIQLLEEARQIHKITDHYEKVNQ